MKSYYRIMLGRGSVYAKEAHDGNYIGAGWFENVDLSNDLPENRRDFNKKFIPLYLEKNPGKSKIAAGLACGMLYTVAKGISAGDIVLCPDGQRNYWIGEVLGDYQFQPGTNLPHRRTIRWFPKAIPRDEMSEALQYATGSIGAGANVSGFADEIENFISGTRPATIISTDETVEDFLVQNWKSTELGKKYDIYEEGGESVGQQYPSDTGPIDILAISKDKKEILVVELKKGRIGDVVVGQIQRYMGFVKDELVEDDQIVRGVIIAFEDDIKVRRALSVAQNIDFYTYKVSFKLEKK